MLFFLLLLFIHIFRKIVYIYLADTYLDFEAIHYEFFSLCMNQTRRPGYARPIWMILKITFGPYKTRLDHILPYQTILDNFAPFQTILDHFVPFQIIFTILSNIYPFWTITQYFGKCVNHVGPVCTCLHLLLPVWTCLKHVGGI